MLPKSQKGFIHLGIFGVLLLVGAVAVGTRLVSNPELIFNIAERAAGAKCEAYDVGDCEGNCSPAGFKCQARGGECKTSGTKCGGGGSGGGKVVEECVQQGGQCLTSCAGSGLVNSSGDCNKGVCCNRKVYPTPDEAPADCEEGKQRTQSCYNTTLGRPGEIRQECKSGKWDSISECSPLGSGSGTGSGSCGATPNGQTASAKCTTSDGCTNGTLTQKCTNGGWDPVTGCSLGQGVACQKPVGISSTITGGVTSSCTTAQVLNCSAELKACEAGKCVTTSTSNSTSGGGGTKCIYGNCEVPLDATNCTQGKRCELGCNSATGKCYPPEAKEYGTLCGPLWRVTGWWKPGDAHTFGNMRDTDLDICPSGCDTSTGRCKAPVVSNPQNPPRQPSQSNNAQVCIRHCFATLFGVCIVANPLSPSVCVGGTNNQPAEDEPKLGQGKPCQWNRECESTKCNGTSVDIYGLVTNGKCL